MEALTDETLVAGVAAGDRQAATLLVRRYQARVFGLVLTIVGDRHVAEDVAQEVFLRVWRHAGSFDARRGSFQSWLLAIARNLAIDTVRLRRQQPVEPSEASRLAAAVLGPVSAAETAAARDFEAERVRDALRALPVDQRRAVLLAVFGGWTAAEIAERDTIPLGTAKSRVRLGLARLRTTLGAPE